MLFVSIGCRLGGLIEFAGVRRDGANLISKLVQPLLQILGDKDACGIWVCTQGGLHFGVSNACPIKLFTAFDGLSEHFLIAVLDIAFTSPFLVIRLPLTGLFGGPLLVFG